MARERFRNLFLIVAFVLMSFGCSFNAGGNGSISISLPHSECSRNINNEGESLEGIPENFRVQVTYADGKSILDTVGKAGENIFLKDLVSGQYNISLTGETPNFVFIGESVANVVEETQCDVDVNIEAWKKGQIKLNFNNLTLTDHGNLINDFTVKVLDASTREKKEVYSQTISTASLPADKKVMLGKTFPNGVYTLKIVGGNPNNSYRVNKDIDVHVDYGKVYVCGITEHEAITYFVSSSGNDITGTGEKTNPYKTVTRITELLKDIHVPVRITLLDDVTENGLISFNVPHSRVVLDSKNGSKLIVKGGINVSSGRVTLDNNAIIGGGNKISVAPDATFIMKGSAKVLDDTIVSLQQGAILRLGGDLTNDVAAYIEMFNPKNKTVVLGEYVESEKKPIPNLLKNNCGKIKFITSQKYDIKEDCKAWAQIPVGYVGIDDAVAALSSGSGDLTVKAFVDDTTEFATLVSSIASTPATSVNLDLKANSRIKAIGNGQFKSNTKLKGIIIPDTISSVGNDAFSGCILLDSVNFGKSVSSIGANAFNGCKALKNIDISNALTTIGSGAFVGSGLSGKLSIPANIKTIGNNAFASLPITELVFVNGLETIGTGAFSNCTSLNTAVVFPDTLKTIGDSAFASSTITNVTFNEGLTSIGASAFKGCPNIKNVMTFPASVKTIGNSAFENSAITGVVLSEGLKTIGNAAFRGAASLTGNIKMPQSLTTVGDSAFESDTLIVGVNINSGLASLGNSAFKGCTGIIGSITLPKSIKNVNTSVFEDCSGITSVTIESGIGHILNNAFKGCTSLASVTIPSGVGTIRSYAFASSGLTSVVVPSSVWSIYDNAFNGCTKLNSVKLNEGLSSIGTSAFNGCSSLSSLSIPSSVITIGANIVAGTSVSSVTMEDASIKWDKNNGGRIEGGTATADEINAGCTRPLSVSEAVAQLRNGGTKNIKVNITSESEMTELKKAIQNTPNGSVNLDLRTTLTKLPRESFANCTYLTSIKIPEGVTSIEKFAFANNVNLTSVTLPSSLTKIVEKAFTFCSKLQSITIPANVTFIEAYAFNECSSLNSATFASGNTQWNLKPMNSSSASTTYTTGTPADNAKALINTYLKYTWNKN